MSSQETKPTQDKNPPAEPRKIEVKLRLHHTHAGEFKKPGATISVTPRQKQWLQARGIIEPEEHK